MRKLYLLLVLSSIIIAACNGDAGEEQDGTTTDTTAVNDQPADDAGGGDLVWVQMDPKQCLTNPWEQAWIEAGNNEADYPVGEPRVVEAEEQQIIREYYAGQGITINQIDSESYDPDISVCEGCDCFQGYTLYLQVNSTDAERLEAAGFQESTRL